MILLLVFIIFPKNRYMYRVKSIPDSVKDVSVKDRTVKLYYSSFDKIDSDGEVVRRGALTKTQSEWGPGGKNRIWHLDNHMTLNRVGKPKEMGEDEFGAWAVTKIANTQSGKDALALYESGDITEHSFGFRVLQSEGGEIDGHQATILTELQQFEYSSVNWGANMNTPTIEVKSLEETKQKLIEEHKKWQKWLRKGNLSDEFCHLLDVQIQQWSEQIKALEELSEPPVKSTPAVQAADISAIFEKYNFKQQIEETFNGRN